MAGQLKPSVQMTLPGFDNVTSSPESQAGPSLSSSPDAKTSNAGPVRCRASLSASGASDGGQLTLDISSPSGSTSSAIADLQSSLANRLQACLDANGSLECGLIWRKLAMPSGVPLCQLAPSGPRTDATGCTLALWPTPTAGDGNGGHVMKDCTITGKARDGRKINVSLAGVARLVAARGAAPNGSMDPTASGAGLDPAFSCWLMGLPLAVDACAPTATPSSRNSALRSSRPSSKRGGERPRQRRRTTKLKKIENDTRSRNEEERRHD
jgi:hypothetical protein